MNRNVIRSIARTGFAVAVLPAVLAFLIQSGAYAQSTDQNYPTPATAPEIVGVIKARDIGDSRLTTYYYLINADNGDLFLNVLTKNFSGDIDLFTLPNLQPMSKIVIYADLPENETGRVVYLRKPEQLLLRIQGRTPGDDPASFRIKFAGSFVAAKGSDVPEAPELPKVTAQNSSGVVVNSVGTIIERPAPQPARNDQAKAVEDTAKKRPAERANEPALEERRAEKRPEPSSRPGVRPVREPVESRPETAKARTPRPKRPVAAVENKERKEKPAARAEAKKSTPRPKPAEEAPDPMASIRLVVSFKDGTKIERQMNEVLRFSVDKGVLTVISKDGAVGRYSMLDVARVTIE